LEQTQASLRKVFIDWNTTEKSRGMGKHLVMEDKEFKVKI